MGSLTGGNMTAFSSSLFQVSEFHFGGARPFYSTLPLSPKLFLFHASKQSAILTTLWLEVHHSNNSCQSLYIFVPVVMVPFSICFGTFLLLVSSLIILIATDIDSGIAFHLYYTHTTGDSKTGSL